MNDFDQILCRSIISRGKKIRRESWVKVSRSGSLLLALPLNRDLALATLCLYQPQKWKGRCLQFAMKLLVLLRLYQFLPQCSLEIGDRGLLAGLDRLISAGEFGFLLGNPDSECRNLIGLCEIDEKLCVVKAGVGRATGMVQHEYQAMKRFSDNIPGVPSCISYFEFDTGSAYVAEFVRGRSPCVREDEPIVMSLLHSWLKLGQRTNASKLDCWVQLQDILDSESYRNIEALAKQQILAPVMHGDFAPWNIKINSQDNVKVLDWESAEDAGMPGWDVLHYHVQRMTLVEGVDDAQIVAECRDVLKKNNVHAYLREAGLVGMEEQLLGFYFYHSAYIQGYSRQGLIKAWEDSCELVHAD